VIQRRADQFAAYLSDPSHIGSSGMVSDFYFNGYINEMGFQYLADKPVCILVNNGGGKSWIVRYIPSSDPEIIDQFVQAYDGSEEYSTRWVFLPEYIHYVN
jgi:hypothetical protein